MAATCVLVTGPGDTGVSLRPLLDTVQEPLPLAWPPCKAMCCTWGICSTPNPAPYLEVVLLTRYCSPSALSF